MSPHARAEQLATLAVDFTLDARMQHELDSHLATCSACRAFAAGVRADAAQLRAIASVPAPVRVRVAVTEAVASPGRMTWRLLDGSSTGRLRLLVGLAAAAALLMWLIATGIFVGGRANLGIEHTSPAPELRQLGGLPPPVVATVAVTVPVCVQANSLQAASGALWFMCGTDAWRMDGSSRIATRFAHNAGALAVAGGDVWAIGSDMVVRLRWDTGEVVSRVSHSGGTAGIADQTALWVADTGAGMITRIDPATNRIVASIKVGSDPEGLALAAGDLWVANRGSNTVSQINSRTNRVVATILVGAGPLGIAVAGGAVWVANNSDGTVSQIDSTSNGVETVSVDPASSASVLPGIAAQADRWIWVVDAHTNRLIAIDVASRSVARQLSIPFPASSSTVHSLDTIAVIGGSIWAVDVAGSLIEFAEP